MLYRRRRFILSALVSVLIAGLAAQAEAGTHVYLLRGLLDVSTGLDNLAAKLKRRGYAAIVTGHGDEADIATTAIRNFRAGTGCPVVIVGHSLGADAAVSMAQTLQRAHVSVALIVTFSPAHSTAVPSNVARAVNYYQSNSFWNNVYTRAAGSHGTLRNIDLQSMRASIT